MQLFTPLPQSQGKRFQNPATSSSSGGKRSVPYDSLPSDVVPFPLGLWDAVATEGRTAALKAVRRRRRRRHASQPSGVGKNERQNSMNANFFSPLFGDGNGASGPFLDFD